MAGADAAGGVPLRVEAISEVGCEVRLPADWRGRLAKPDGELAGGWTLQLEHPLLAGDAWPVREVCESQRPSRLGLLWGPLSGAQRERLHTYLYRRAGLWPTLRAPWDPLALAVAAGRLLGRVEPERWFCRSLVAIS